MVSLYFSNCALEIKNFLEDICFLDLEKGWLSYLISTQSNKNLDFFPSFSYTSSINFTSGSLNNLIYFVSILLRILCLFLLKAVRFWCDQSITWLQKSVMTISSNIIWKSAKEKAKILLSLFKTFLLSAGQCSALYRNTYFFNTIWMFWVGKNLEDYQIPTTSNGKRHLPPDQVVQSAIAWPWTFPGVGHPHLLWTIPSGASPPLQ